MNGNLYQNPTFPTIEEETYDDVVLDNDDNNYDLQCNIKNLVELNKGKKVKIYTSYANPSEWQSKIFEGLIEKIVDDFIILKDTREGTWNIIKMSYLDYIEFDEKLDYNFI